MDNMTENLERIEMRAVVTRVLSASVTIDGKEVAAEEHLNQ